MNKMPASAFPFFLLTWFLIPFSGFTQTRDLSFDSLPEPSGWFTGDIHVHRNCGDGTAVFDKDSLASMMGVSGLSVISLLADMGNGEVKYAPADLPNVNGKDDALSSGQRLVHWDAEWHWDATYSNFNHQALGGHLVLLGLKEAHQIWDESLYKVLQWARGQEAVTGFAHFEYLKDSFQQNLNCCIPVEYPIEAALGTIDFVSEDVFGISSPNNGNYNSEAVLTAWYKLLNCGFRLSLAAGTDFPCNNLEPLGQLLTYVDLGKKPLSYDGWIRGLKAGRTVVSRDAHNEFLDFKVNKTLEPGEELKMSKGQPVACTATWTSTRPVSGSVELVCNGKVIATQKDSVCLGKKATLTFQLPIKTSSWITARCMGPNGHLLQTGAVYVVVANKPIRASAADARYYMDWIDSVLANTKSNGTWSRYFTHDQETVFARYRKARDIFEKIYHESDAR